MMPSLDDMLALRFSTDEVPERDRLAVAREVVGRSLARADFEPDREGPFHYRCAARVLPGLAVVSQSCSRMTCRRTGEYLTDGNDDVVLCMTTCTGTHLRQLGRELAERDSHACLVSTADALVVTAVSVPHSLHIALPRRALAPLVPGLEDAFLQPIPMNNEALQLLTSYVRLLDGTLTLKTPEVRRSFVRHVYDLAALAIGASQDAAEAAKKSGVRAARLHAIKADILASSSQNELTIAEIALRHCVTPRYVQMLFESEGTTFSRFLLDQRLARAHRMLSDPRLAERAISTIAYAAGFGDLSHFNRAFRGRYGETPSDVRSSARRSDS
jgi:AraC-like DNA-binding protein